VFNCSGLKDNRHPIIFATYAELPQQLYYARVMIESIRTFGGDYKDAPVWLYSMKAILLRQCSMIGR